MVQSPVRREANAMKLYKFFANLLIAVALLGAPPKGLAAEYCYLGTVVDDTTGEILDLYGLCVDESQENLDPA
jgi:hypothetical protein